MLQTQIEKMRNEFKKRDYKFTPQRQAVLEVLVEHKESHLSVDEIYYYVKLKHPDLGMATVYRTLDLLCTLGMVQKLNFGDGKSRFEVSKEEKHQHHHLICLNCNDIIEVKGDLLIQLEAMIEKEYNFETTDHVLQIYGYCHRCRMDQ
jgi:Fur family ferric uptake transcriptional regulator